MAQIRDDRFVDAAYLPSPAAVAAKAAATNTGLDTATVLTRRDTLKALAAAYRAKVGADLDVASLFDAIIAAGFDA